MIAKTKELPPMILAGLKAAKCRKRDAVVFLVDEKDDVTGELIAGSEDAILAWAGYGQKRCLGTWYAMMGYDGVLFIGVRRIEGLPQVAKSMGDILVTLDAHVEAGRIA